MTEPTEPNILDFIRENISRTPQGFNPIRFVELFGRESVPIQHYEPDARTFRHDFYYNSRTNQLFRRIKSGTFPVWRPISN